MPMRPPHPCARGGCGELTHERYCAAHKRDDLAEMRKATDRRRGTPAERGYDAAWRKVRAAVLRDEPLCRMCKADGRVIAATRVDHVDGNPWNRARSNLRPLCESHHNRRTARDQGFGRKRRAR